MSGTSKSTAIVEDCPGIELNAQSSYKIVRKVCCLGNLTGARGGSIDFIITRIRSG